MVLYFLQLLTVTELQQKSIDLQAIYPLGVEKPKKHEKSTLKAPDSKSIKILKNNTIFVLIDKIPSMISPIATPSLDSLRNSLRNPMMVLRSDLSLMEFYQ